MIIKDKLVIQLINVILTTVLISCFGLFLFLTQKYNNFSLSQTQRIPTDFIMYLTGATILKEGTVARLYDGTYQEAIQRKIALPYTMGSGLLAYRTPPLTAMIYIPFTYLATPQAFYLNVVLNLLLLCITVYLLFKMLDIKMQFFIPSLSFCLLFLPVFITTVMGQISLLLTFIIVCSIYISRKNSFLAGALLTLLFLKPTFVIFVPLLLLLQKRENYRKFVKGFILGSIVFWAINIFIYGPNLIIDYPVFVLKSESFEYGTAPEHQFNFVSIIWLVVHNQFLANIIATILSISIYAVVTVISKNKLTNLKLLAGIFILLPLLNLHTMISDLVIYLIPLAIILKIYLDRKINTITFATIISLLWILTWIGIYGLQYISTSIGVALVLILNMHANI